ncbi:hypothetical protein BWQ96_04697 [Gracilariopsis chorda]|uniref:Uncharacterized protein n=1 Tax=Gracilariopsis chorda TaxID=448386 RepID=A0A2V3ITY7_9FLOR|nr:hypothetical protein BWQ96_04697 [Gracilariopsis chorda]|eukprot:PXF45559.1 hypothetical protein BWQ96_04697 [Gracilariopsis chorda]
MRAEQQNRSTNPELSNTRGERKSLLQANAGINEGSVLFNLSSIVPYSSISVDIMHLFYNIGKDIFRRWINSSDEMYSIAKATLNQIYFELKQFGKCIPIQLGCRTRLFSRSADYKFTKVKDFILSYSLLVLDGHLSEQILSGCRHFVEIVEICWRTALGHTNLGKLRVLFVQFYQNYEQYYLKGD